MNKDIQKPIENYLKKSSQKVVDFVVREKKVKYDKSIKSHREIKTISGDEEAVRSYLVAKLINELGYKKENIELEKEYDIGRPKVNKPRIDVIVRDDSGDAFLYIELKSPQDYEKDKDEVIDDEVKDKCILIDYEKFKSFDEWKEIRDFADELPERYGKAQKEPYIKGTKDLETNFTHEKLDG